MGTTDYAGAFREVVNHFFGGGKKKGFFKRPASNGSGPAELPVYSIFVTDGAPDSASEAKKELIKASEHAIFWKFLSVGKEPMKFLELLDDMDGRKIDNADYKPMGDIDNFTDDQVFEALLDEYPGFISEAKRVGILV